MNPVDLAQHVGAHPVFFLAAAFFLGALHGLEPGHSKGLMAAFIVGTRGSYGQAMILALCATISHTAVVWLLAWPASYGGLLWSGAQLAPYLNLISGIVVLGLAYWMLRRFNRAHAQGGHHPRHGDDHHEDSGHHHDHDGHHHHHDHDHGHGVHDHHHAHEDHGRHDEDKNVGGHVHAVATRSEAEVRELSASLELEDEHARLHAREIAEKFSGHEVSTAQVAMFGLSTGLAPCSAAIVILITCFRLHQPWLGMALVGCFSLGLGFTLTSVALLASWGMRTVGRRSRGFQGIVEKAPFLSALVTAAIGIYLIVQFFRSY